MSGGCPDGDWSAAFRIGEVLRALERESAATSRSLTSRLFSSDVSDATERAQRAARLAVLAARQGGWWAVLARRTPPGVPEVYRRAAIAARFARRGDAQFWRDQAASWRRIGESADAADPASDPAGRAVAGGVTRCGDASKGGRG